MIAPCSLVWGEEFQTKEIMEIGTENWVSVSQYPPWPASLEGDPGKPLRNHHFICLIGNLSFTSQILPRPVNYVTIPSIAQKSRSHPWFFPFLPSLIPIYQEIPESLPPNVFPLLIICPLITISITPPWSNFVTSFAWTPWWPSLRF